MANGLILSRFPRLSRPLFPWRIIGASGSGAGSVKNFAFDNTTAFASYNAGEAPTPVLRAQGGDPLAATLTGFTEGNVVLIAYSVTAFSAAGEGSVNVDMTLQPTLDIGSGVQSINTPVMRSVTTPFYVAPMTWVTFIRPTGITAPPKAGLLISGNATDAVRINAYGALVAAIEVDASFVSQLPSTVLV